MHSVIRVGLRTSRKMAGFAAQAALRSKWGDLVDSGAATLPALPEPTEAITGLKNVVGWLKQVHTRFYCCITNLVYYKFVIYQGSGSLVFELIILFLYFEIPFYFLLHIR